MTAQAVTLTIIFNWIEQLRIPQYNSYSSTLFDTIVSISTALWECAIGTYLSEWGFIEFQMQKG